MEQITVYMYDKYAFVCYFKEPLLTKFVIYQQQQLCQLCVDYEFTNKPIIFFYITDLYSLASQCYGCHLMNFVFKIYVNHRPNKTNTFVGQLPPAGQILFKGAGNQDWTGTERLLKRLVLKKKKNKNMVPG